MESPSGRGCDGPAMSVVGWLCQQGAGHIGGGLTMSVLGWPCGGWAGHVRLALLVMDWPVGGLTMSVMGYVACCGLLSAMNLWD